MRETCGNDNLNNSGMIGPKDDTNHIVCDS